MSMSIEEGCPKPIKSFLGALMAAMRLLQQTLPKQRSVWDKNTAPEQ
jgi:hypothetical protein